MRKLQKSVDDDPIEARFRRLESKIDRLNDDNKKLNEQVNELMPLKDEVNQLKETVKKQEDVIRQWLLGKQRDDKDNKDYAVGIAEGGF